MTGMSAATLEWLEARGLDVELCDRRGLFSQNGASGEAVGLPTLHHGARVRCKYRPLIREEGKPKFYQDKGGQQIAYNVDCLYRDDLLELPLIVTEGEFDQLAAEQAGFERSISVPDGSPGKPSEDIENSKAFAWIEPVAEQLSLKRVKTIILAVDGDEAGAALLHDLAIKLGRSRCKFVTYPKAKDPEKRGRERLKDVGEVLEDYGVKGVQAVIARAQWIRVEGIYRLSELPPPPPTVTYDIGFDALSAHLKIRLRDMSIWTGLGGHGKSTLLNDVMCRIIKRYGITVGWCSFEQDAGTDHRRALRTWYCEDYEWNLKPEQIKEADAWIERHHLFIVANDEVDADLDWLLDRMEAAVVQNDCKCLIVDPFNEVEHCRMPGENEVDYVNRAVRTLRRFAKRMGVHLVIVAHPTKMPRLENGTYMMPGLLDVSGGAVWNNKATQGVIVHLIDADTTLVKVPKIKYRGPNLLGVPGMVKMQFCGQTGRFVEMERNVVDFEPQKKYRR